MKPTNRELIEGAAKSAGVTGYWSEEWEKFFPTHQPDWNPLESKADAFDLMCALELEPVYLTVSLMAVYAPKIAGLVEEPITSAQSKEAATMRAITRAAYAVWKEKENG